MESMDKIRRATDESIAAASRRFTLGRPRPATPLDEFGVEDGSTPAQPTRILALLLIPPVLLSVGQGQQSDGPPYRSGAAKWSGHAISVIRPSWMFGCPGRLK